MKHLTYGDKTLFLGDEAADTLTDYAALLADRGRADSVVLNAIGPDGHAVEATFVLDSGVNLMTETADGVFIEPDNQHAIRYMSERIDAIITPPNAQALSQSDLSEFESDFDGPPTSA